MSSMLKKIVAEFFPGEAVLEVAPYRKRAHK